MGGNIAFNRWKEIQQRVLSPFLGKMNRFAILEIKS